MLNQETKRKIDSCRDILVGKLPDPKAQIEQITNALIYKFMSDMDKLSVDMGGNASFFVGDFAQYAWDKLMSPKLGGSERLSLYSDALGKLSLNPHLPQLFRDIFKDAFLPYRDAETLNMLLKEINWFTYTHSEDLGDAFEYLLSVMGSQGDAGQFRTPRHIIDFIVESVDPKKDETILDPACGTAGFLISSYKHILQGNTAEKSGDKLTPEEKTDLMKQFTGYDISPDMVRFSLVNMYLHGFPEPHIFEYDTLSDEKNWKDSFDVIMANPPFMSPKGGIRPHKRFSIQANRSEVLFVDYIAEHLNAGGRAGVIVPEGIIFQSGTAYKALRKMLVDNYLFCVVSLPAGVFNPYSGVKTSILLMDKTLAKKTDKILFIKIGNDGLGLGAQRKSVQGNELPQAIIDIKTYLQSTRNDKAFYLSDLPNILLVPKQQLGETGDYNLSMERYRTGEVTSTKWPLAELDSVCTFTSGLWKGEKEPLENVNILRNTNFTKSGTLDYSDIATHPVEIKQLQTRQLLYGDLILEKSGGGPAQPVGRVALFDKKEGVYSYSNFTARIRVKDNELLNPFFFWRCLKFLYDSGATENLQKQTSGIRNLDLNAYKKLGIPLPPLNIQQEIVAEIESYQKIIDGARQVVKNYKPQIKIDPNWPVVELGEICKPQYGFTTTGKDQGDARLIRITDIGADGALIPNEAKYLTLDAESKEYLLKQKDVLIARTGATFGKTMLFKENYPAVFASFLIRLNFFKPDNILPEYYWSFSQSEGYWKQANQLMTGGGQPQFNGNALIKIKIPLPDVNIQREIVSKIEKEQQLVNANKQLIQIYEQKIKSKIAEVWET